MATAISGTITRNKSCVFIHRKLQNAFQQKAKQFLSGQRTSSKRKTIHTCTIPMSVCTGSKKYSQNAFFSSGF